MSKPELIKLLKNKHPQLNNPQLEKIIDVFFKSIEKALIQNRSVALKSFGTFFIKEIKASGNLRNPKTGELIYRPKRNKVRFRASKKFKEFINQ